MEFRLQWKRKGVELTKSNRLTRWVLHSRMGTFAMVGIRIWRNVERWCKVVLIFAIIGHTVIIFSLPAFAVRPFFITEYAVPVERGGSRLEIGLTYKRLSPNHRTYQLLSELTQGIINNLDFEIEVPYIVSSGVPSSDGIGDISLKSKLRFLKGREANPLSLSGQLLIKFPACDEDKGLSEECTGEADVGVLGIASKEFHPVIVHLNLGYILIGNPGNQDFRDVFRYSLAFDYLTALESLRLIAEFAGETQRDPNESADPVALQFGALMGVGAGIAFDGSFGFGLTRASPDFFINSGLTYRF